MGKGAQVKVHYADALRRPILANGLGLTGTAAALPAGGAPRIVGASTTTPRGV